MEEHQEKKEKKRKWLILLLLLLLLLFAVGIVTGSYIRRLQVQPCNPFHEDADAEIGIMPGMSEQEIQKRLNQVVAKNMMNVTINTEPAFQNGRAKGNLCIENIKQNHVNFIVSIHLDHNDKEIYVSGLLRPNH